MTSEQLEELGDKGEFHEAEVLGQVPGAMFIVSFPVVGFAQVSHIQIPRA